ncbi:hypothetical protein [Paraflavitalea pollutisoli]|uniref:hypothetical protein n=1 Tax=Paraflavitalea pollutisoli TaxID=3034143 RepID=UPI0023ECCD05|nr:hypothetical protein [Paraflavitalea sp. H1-2-19X]
MNNIPGYISLIFTVTTALSLYLFYRATKPSGTTVMVILTWLALQGILAFFGFYLVTETTPPRFILAIAPALITILLLFLLPPGRQWMDSWKLQRLTWLHVVRVPVELVLFWLYQHGQVPLLMTFEGSNPDILSGLTAPLIAWLAFRSGSPRRALLIAWNLLCLGLLLNIVIRAILSAPTPFQQWGFEQPNIGVLQLPFVWLPAFIVPVVLLSHLAALRQLLFAPIKSHDQV